MSRKTPGGAALLAGSVLSRLFGSAEPVYTPVTPSQAAVATQLRAMVDAGRLLDDVKALSQPRGHGHAIQAMTAAQTLVTETLEHAGWPVRTHPFGADDATAGVNLTALRLGTVGAQTYVLGAHLDTVAGSPGADDNASGVACLLEVARVLSGQRFEDNVLLALFDEEENGLIGSTAIAPEIHSEYLLAGVIVLECVGYFDDTAGSQRLPDSSELLYASQITKMRRRQMRGDWTLLAYQARALELAAALASNLCYLAGEQSVILAREPLDLPILGPALRRFSSLGTEFARSDHKPFWDLGVPAVQMTDTADFRNPHYHQATDTPETLNYERMADIAGAAAATIAQLARMSSGA